MCAISWQLSPATAIFLTFVKLIFAQYLIEFQQWAKIFQNNKIQTFHVLAFKTSEIWTISIFTIIITIIIIIIIIIITIITFIIKSL